MQVSEDTLEKHLIIATNNLLDIARISAWNHISSNCQFIITKFENCDIDSQNNRTKRRIEKNKKDAKTLHESMDALLQIYPDIYNIELYIQKAVRNQTTIEIRYYPKSLLTADNKDNVNAEPIRINCKVPVPVYASLKNQKFDINWEHNTFSHKWNLLWFRCKYVLKAKFSNYGQ